MNLSNPKTWDELRTEISAALLPLAQKHNLTFNFGVGKHLRDGTKLTVPIEILTGEKSEAESREFARKAKILGVDPNYYGQKFVVRNPPQELEIYGISLTSSVYPILVRDKKGREYKYPRSILTQFLPKNEKGEPQTIVQKMAA